MKKKSTITTAATVGSRLKFGLPLTSEKPRKRRKAVKKAAQA